MVVAPGYALLILRQEMAVLAVRPTAELARPAPLGTLSTRGLEAEAEAATLVPV
jgi:hypothetical protein